MSDRMTLDRAFRILRNELEGYATITRTRLAIEVRDRGYVERQVDYWLGAYKRRGEIRITYLTVPSSHHGPTRLTTVSMPERKRQRRPRMHRRFLRLDN